MRRSALLALPIAAAALACGSSKDDTPPPPRTASPLATAGVTSFGQSVPVEGSPAGEVFPGQANRWSLDNAFALAAPGLQYDTALALYVGAPAQPITHASLLNEYLAPAGVLDPFPQDQSMAEAVFLSPVFTAADGVRTAAASNGISMGVPALAGNASGYLNGTSDSRLARTISIVSGEPYSLQWDHQVLLYAGLLDGSTAAPYGPSYQVVLRDTVSGSVLATLFAATTLNVDPAQGNAVDLPGGLPAQVDLSFELRSGSGGLVVLDDVMLLDNSVPVPSFTNGDFEGAALAPWRASAGAESQNVRSGARLVGPGAGPKVSVTRTFYAHPSAAWGRLVDVFENTGAAPVTTTAVYVTLLSGFTPVSAVRAGGMAVVGWDSDHLSRDVGLVHGTGAAYVDPASNVVFAVHPITVPAGGKVALAHYVVQLGRSEGGLTAADVPAGTDSACAAIVAGFRTDQQYVVDLEPGVLEAIANF